MINKKHGFKLSCSSIRKYLAEFYPFGKSRYEIQCFLGVGSTYSKRLIRSLKDQNKIRMENIGWRKTVYILNPDDYYL